MDCVSVHEDCTPVRVDVFDILRGLKIEDRTACDVDQLVRDMEREFKRGMSTRSGLGVDFSMDAFLVIGTLKFHFSLGREFKPDVLRNELETLIQKCLTLSEMGPSAPYNDLTAAARKASGERIVTPDGQVWGNEQN